MTVINAQAETEESFKVRQMVKPAIESKCAKHTKLKSAPWQNAELKPSSETKLGKRQAEGIEAEPQH